VQNAVNTVFIRLQAATHNAFFSVFRALTFFSSAHRKV